jgi:hypothetical protein
MLPTIRARIALVAVVSIILTPYLGDVSQAAECRIAPIKAIRCVRGIVIDPSGLPISNAKVTILRAGTEFVSIRTNTDGKFSFDRFEAGDYAGTALIRQGQFRVSNFSAAGRRTQQRWTGHLPRSRP